jgi:outer membrane lipoprotein-sorting protein
MALLVGAILVPALGVLAQEYEAFEVLDRARANWQGETFHGFVFLEIVQAGKTTVYRVEVWSQGDDYGLVRFLVPEADAGSGYLMVEDKVWYYAPAAGKAVPLPGIAAADSIFGSGPALEDLIHGTLSDKYDATMARDGTDYVLTLTPKPDAAVVYGSLVVRVRADFAIVSIEYYDQRGAVLRTARFSDYVDLPGRVIPTTIVIEEKNGDRSVERLENVEFGITIDPQVFTVENLEADQ